ncbi:MAG: STAS domain-containing protein [Deltaproteobacteria bacterium]|nr:STAS domain-containing protein [Deltaproteobacteria bacterium]
MEIKKTESDNGATLSITGSMTIYDASELRQHLLACLEEHPGMILDLSGVEDCDTAAIQVLCAARKSAELTGKPVSFQQPAGPVIEAAHRAGLVPEHPIFSKGA